jgi:uncharacterized membrane protein
MGDHRADDASAPSARVHTHRVQSQQCITIDLVSGALVLAGLSMLMPGRIMHAGVLGP